MTAHETEHRTVRRGRTARQASRLARPMESLPYLTRTLPPVEVVSAEGLEPIEHNADTLLEEVGIEIVNYPEAVEIFRGRRRRRATGTRVRFPRGMCRSIIQATAPRVFTQRARNPARERRHRRPARRPRADLRLAVHPQPRRRPALRDDRGLPQLREAHVHEPRPSTTAAARCASRSTCRSTSATSRWSTATSATRTRRSWARSPIRAGPRTRSTWRASCSAPRPWSAST